MWASAARTGSISAAARGVRRSPSGPRVNSSSPNNSRSRARLWLIADWPIPTRAAARVTLRSVSIASKCTSKFKSIRDRLTASMSIIDPICLIDNHSLPISWGNGRHGRSIEKAKESPMSIRSTLTAAAVTLALSGAAQAEGLRPIQAQSIDLGGVSGVAYYTVESDGFHVVTTLAQGAAGTPIRIVSVLAPGQSVVLSTAQQAGSLTISRNGDKVLV